MWNMYSSHCPPFADGRETLRAQFSPHFSSETITKEMLLASETVERDGAYVAQVIRELKRVEKARRRHPITYISRAPNSQFALCEIMLDGGSVGWRDVMGIGFSG